jgi:hypothetical protein
MQVLKQQKDLNPTFEIQIPYNTKPLQNLSPPLTPHVGGGLPPMTVYQPAYE